MIGRRSNPHQILYLLLPTFDNTLRLPYRNDLEMALTALRL
jgi:hypothetical protein